MKNILSFLQKFQGLVRNKSFVEESCESVFKDLSLPLSKEDFEIVGQILHIKSFSAPLRTEIKLRKNKILEQLNKTLGVNSIVDIK